MKTPHIQRVQLMLFLLERLLSKSAGGRADYDALGEFRRLCWAILILADDAECKRQVDSLVQYGNELYSDQGGAEALRLKIRQSVACLRTRLQVLALPEPRVAFA